MSNTSRRDFRHTKIICTLGPVSSDERTLRALAQAGMNVARLNMSHGDHVSHGAAIETIQRLNEELNHPIAILLDTQGPEIRTGERKRALLLSAGDDVTLSVDPREENVDDVIFVNYPDITKDLSKGETVTLDNGIINLQVLEVSDPHLRCRVIDGGRVGSRRHVNLPGVRVNLPSITEKDAADIAFGLARGVDGKIRGIV
jgi:pyruvate kinase